LLDADGAGAADERAVADEELVEDRAVRAARGAEPGVGAVKLPHSRDTARDMAVAGDRRAADRRLRLDAGDRGEVGASAGAEDRSEAVAAGDVAVAADRLAAERGVRRADTDDLLDPGDVGLGNAEGLRARDPSDCTALREGRDPERLR